MTPKAMDKFKAGTRPLTLAEIEQVKKFAEEYKAFHPTSEAEL